MAFTVTDLIIGAAIGFGATEIISGMTKDAAPTTPKEPTLPDQKTADTNAQATVANQRQVLLAAGGQTDYTGGLGVLTGSDVSKSTLVGG